MARLIFIILAVVFFFGCYQSQIEVSGNIERKVFLNQTGNLLEILHSKAIVAEYLLLIATDGTAVFICEKSFSELEIIRKKGKFATQTGSLPPVCNLNEIKEICIYNSSYPLSDHQTPFSLRLQEFQFLGESSQAGHYVRKYKLKGV